MVDNPGTNPVTPAESRDEDARSDIEQAVNARSDAVSRREGGDGNSPAPFTAPGLPDGVGGTGGTVRNQNADAQ